MGASSQNVPIKIPSLLIIGKGIGLAAWRLESGCYAELSDLYALTPDCATQTVDVKLTRLSLDLRSGPMVEELLELYNRIVLSIKTPHGLLHIRVRAALLYVACDILARRRVCGFCNHCWDGGRSLNTIERATVALLSIWPWKLGKENCREAKERFTERENSNSTSWCRIKRGLALFYSFCITVCAIYNNRSLGQSPSNMHAQDMWVNRYQKKSYVKLKG